MNRIWVDRATLVSIAAVILAFYQTTNPDLLLLLPPVCVVLGWTCLVNDEKISAIGRYIRLDLGPRLVTLLECTQPIYGWEVAHRSDRLTAPLPALLAVIVAAERLVVVVFAHQINE